ncbi:MAG: Gldg family protein [Deltaproteobacteria bacterium]|nr:Gldg family protein [Deltaproteobacteria bacterium]
MKIIWTIAKREFRAYFVSPTAYIYLTAFLVLTNWFFWRSFFIVGQNNLRGLFTMMPFIYLFFVPAVAMGKWSEERKYGTIELLFTLPISEWEVVLGKFLAALGLLTSALLLTLPLPATLFFLGKPDPGPMIGGYLGLVFMGGAYLAIGLWISSLTDNQIIAFILGVIGCFVLLICGEPVITTGLPRLFSSFLQYLGLQSHFDSISRGVMDTRDWIYYFSVIALFLFCNLKSLGKGRWAMIVTAAIGVFTLNILAANHFYRIDLTAQKRYTLSSATQKILKNLKDVVTLRVYFSPDLPPALNNVRQDVGDILSEYKQYGGKNIKVEFINPQADAVEEQKVQMMGIPPIELNVLHKDKQELAKIYLGMTVNFASRQEILAVVQNTNNLEYRLDAGILKVTEIKKPQIGWWVPNEEEFSQAKERLESRYAIRSINEKSLNALEPKEMPVLFFVVPEKLSDNEKKSFQTYLDQGGKAIVLMERIAVAMGAGLKPEGRSNPLEDFFKNYGVTVQEDLVLDPSNAMATFTGGVVQFVVPYPYWVSIRPENFDKSQPMVSELGNLVLPWPSTVSGGTVLFKTTPLAVSSSISATQGSLDPQAASNAMTLGTAGTIPLGAMVDNKMAVVGNTQFLNNTFLQQFPDNGLLLENAVDVFSTGEELISVRSKGVVHQPVALVSDRARMGIKLANIFIGPVVLMAIGFIIAWRRRVSLRA